MYGGPQAKWCGPIRLNEMGERNAQRWDTAFPAFPAFAFPTLTVVTLTDNTKATLHKETLITEKLTLHHITILFRSNYLLM